ncbi:MAG TPA: hypothetical protein PKK60_03175 [archaeon]|nr:hypothetical protein [archaeon]
MINKKVLLFGTIILILLVLNGCTQSPICGDGICSEQESSINSSYLCTSDCVGKINPKDGKNCVYDKDCDKNKKCCGGECYNVFTQGCCDGKIFDLNTQSCCKEKKIYNLSTEQCCENGDVILLTQCCPCTINNGCPTPTSKNQNFDEESIKKGIGWNEDSCKVKRNCNEIKVSCLTNNSYNCKFPDAKNTRAVCIGPCEIVLRIETCNKYFGNNNTKDYETTIDQSSFDNPIRRDNISAALEQCTIKHETRHALENCFCALCRGEINAIEEDKKCENEIKNNLTNSNYYPELTAYQRQYHLDYFTRNEKVNQALQSYHQCLCDNRVMGTANVYRKGTCDECSNKLETELNKINKEETSKLLQPINANELATSTSNSYCELETII